MARASTPYGLGVRALLSVPPSVLLSLLCALPIGLAAQDGDMSRDVEQQFGLGLYHADGGFGGTDKTRITYLPLSWALEKSGWSGQLSVAKLRVEGPGNVLVNLGGVTRAVAADSVRRYSGTGDSLLELGYTRTIGIEDRRLPKIFGESFSLGARVSVKIPTASVEKNLGTGERDVAFQLESSFFLGENTVFATAGYSNRGDSAVFADIESSGYAQIGIARRMTSKTSAGLIYDYRATASQFFGDVKEVSVYAGWELTPAWSLTALMGTGLTAASVDRALYLQLAYRL